MTAKCGVCGRVQRGWHDCHRWRVRDLSCGEPRVYLDLDVRRLLCRSCGKVKILFDKVRKSEYARLSGNDRTFIKGQKYTLLSHWENQLLAANKRLNAAYLLKESDRGVLRAGEQSRARLRRGAR